MRIKIGYLVRFLLSSSLEGDTERDLLLLFFGFAWLSDSEDEEDSDSGSDFCINVI